MRSILSEKFRTLRQFFLIPLTSLYDLVFTPITALKSAVIERAKGKPLPIDTIVKQIFFTGVNALPFIVITALILGIAVIAELSFLLPSFGAGKYVERLSAIVIVREVTPILVALIIVGRSGTAIATELANLKINGELQLLDELGINTDYFLIFPRIIGIIIATTALTVIFAVTAFIGGVIVAVLVNILPDSTVLSKFIIAVHPVDFFSALIKSALSGVAIAVIGCKQGLAVKPSFTEVPKAATKTVVSSILVCFVINIFVTLYVLVL